MKGADARLVSPAESPKASSCSAPEYRQFDFWLGDWDAFDSDNLKTPSARIRVTGLLDGCVLHEEYHDTAGFKGESFSTYDASRKIWHQTWVTNRGQLLILEGAFRDGAMVLSGTEIVNGKQRLSRGTWTAMPGGAHEIGVRSLDDGKTWGPWFDLIFKPHQ